MKHIFIINPRAGKRDQTSRIYTLANQLREKHGVDCTCMLTTCAGGAIDMAREIAESGDQVRLYACGGDGTISEVANGIAGFSNVAMTCIPTGTGNDFLRNYGPWAEQFTDVENLWDSPAIPLDLIDCNGRLCLTIACSGIDAQIADSVHAYSHTPLLNGRGSYLLSVAANFLFRDISHHWRVQLDDEIIDGNFALVSMCNGRYYGGGSSPVPEARLDDGILHTILVKKVSKLTFGRLFTKYSAGDYRHLPQEFVRVSTAKVVRISSQEDIVTCLDGESFHNRDVTLKLSEKKVLFFGPKGSTPNATAHLV